MLEDQGCEECDAIGRIERKNYKCHLVDKGRHMGSRHIVSLRRNGLHFPGFRKSWSGLCEETEEENSRIAQPAQPNVSPESSRRWPSSCHVLRPAQTFRSYCHDAPVPTSCRRLETDRPNTRSSAQHCVKSNSKETGSRLSTRFGDNHRDCRSWIDCQARCHQCVKPHARPQNEASKHIQTCDVEH